MSVFNRRQFLQAIKWLLTASGLTALFTPIVAFFYPPDLSEMPAEPISAGLLEDLPVGAGITIRFGRYPALILHTPEGLRAYSAVCTHFACICKWDAENQVIACPCHEGYFDPLDGSVISGPPPSPLEKLVVQVIDNEILVGGEL
mgnify:CR=1 FL=1